MKSIKVIPKAYIKLRILASFIDYAIYGVLFSIYVYSFGHSTQDGIMQVTGIAVLPLLIVWFLYFVVLESVSITPGHDICKLKVVKTNGYKIGLMDAFKRRICDPIDIFMYGIPAIICIYKTEKHQRLGDLLANTLVVKASDIIETDVIF